MIAKVVGYQGFQSYGDLPYATLKPGKKTLDSNQIWEKTIREQDHQDFYQNSNYHQTMRQNQYDQTVRPYHYRDVPIVKKGTNGSTSVPSRTGFFSQTATSNFEVTGNPAPDLLKTGVEHWQIDPYAKSKAERAEWTFHKPPHQVQSKVGPSEYKKQYGELGSNPRDVIPTLTEDRPRVFDELKLGTTQESKHPPGYTGFIPSIITSSKAIEHGQGTNPRTDFMKTNLKENYHIKMPGYAGHIPQSVINQKKLGQQTKQ